MQGYPVQELTVVDIGEDRLGAVYPLVRTALPDVSPGRWLIYARAFLRRGWMLGLSGPDESFFGFLTCQVRLALRHGSVLHVDNFVAFELGRVGTSRRLLLEAAEARARAEGCAALELRLSGRGHGHASSKCADGWFGMNYGRVGILLMKPTAPVHTAQSDKCAAVAIDA